MHYIIRWYALYYKMIWKKLSLYGICYEKICEDAMNIAVKDAMKVVVKMLWKIKKYNVKDAMKVAVEVAVEEAMNVDLINAMIILRSWQR